MPDDALFAAIQERHGFALPAEYRTMHESGFLTLDRPATAYEFTTPGHHYLWLNDMEWHKLEEIAAFEFPDYLAPHLPHLVPFAFTGAGDYWCWQTDHPNGQDARVLLCPHDYRLAKVYAPSFPAALYRQALEFACYDMVTDENEAANRAFLRRWAVDLAGILPSVWCETLRSLSEAPLVEWTELQFTTRSFLTAQDRAAMERRDIGFPEFDAEIPWCNL